MTELAGTGGRGSGIGGVLVVSPNWLGDAVMALPAIASLKRRSPEARLVVAARRTVASLFRMTPAVDEVLELSWHGRLLSRRSLRDDVVRIQRLGADIAILLPNSFASAWVVHSAAIRERWGYATDLRGPLLSRAIPTPKGSLHQGEYYQRLVRALGVETGSLEPVIAVPAAAVDAARGLLAGRGWDGARPIVAVAPGAAYGTAKRWLPAHVVHLLTRLVDERGAHVALVGGPTDAPTTRWIAGALPTPVSRYVSNLAGETTLDVLAGVLRLASVCVSNDSGAMHLAAATGVPVVALFGPTRERETSPLTAAGGRAEVLTNAVWCRPCMLRECPIDHRCMKGLAPERVFEAVGRLMAGREAM
jgi:heptosyltransferase-2